MSDDMEWIVFVQVFPDLQLPRQVALPNGCTLLRPPLGVDLLYGPTNLHLTAEYPSVQQISQSLTITSDTYYHCKVAAEDQDKAIARVMNKHDPEVRLALYMATGLSVSTTPVQIIKASTDERWSADPTVTSFQGAQTEANVDYALVRSIVRDLARTQFRPAIDYLRKGDAYSDLKTSAGTLGEDAALLEYAKAIEYVTKDEASERDADYEQKRDDIVAGLRKELDGGKSSKKLASRIVSAASELHGLQRRSVRLRVESFSQRMCMSNSWTNSATELIDARNRSLAHPGQGLPQAVRNRLANAREVVVEALFASLPEGTPSRTLKIPNRPPEGPLTPGPTLNWSQHRRKVYRLDGRVEWITSNAPETDHVETQIATTNRFREH